jgi:DNA repair exonuclease SbcCD nuclease subunit
MLYHSSNVSAYTIYEVMELIKGNKELIFEIRDIKEKDGWYDHMLLIPVKGISGNYGLQFY